LAYLAAFIAGKRIAIVTKATAIRNNTTGHIDFVLIGGRGTNGGRFRFAGGAL
jgi:hypothetical protein